MENMSKIFIKKPMPNAPTQLTAIVPKGNLAVVNEFMN
jgi:hypothetical protein